MRKIVAIICTIGMLFGLCACKDNGGMDNELFGEFVDFVVSVEEGRDIRVLQLTDIQTLSADCKRYPDRVTVSTPADNLQHYERYVGQVIERYQPDLIIMTGDNVYGEFDDTGKEHLNLIAFMDSFQIPWAPVFGNHDNESYMGVDWQCEQFEKSQYCLFKQRELTGNGNYSVGIAQGGVLKRVFFMLDSNGCGNMSEASKANGHSSTYAGFGGDQINWYTDSILALQENFPQTKISMAFHIQPRAFADGLAKYGYNDNTISSNPINLDYITAAQEAGDFGYIGASLKGAWDTNYRVWNNIKDLGVDSVFVGHEHCNSASVEYEGVRLTYGLKSSTYDRYYTDDKGLGIGGTYITLSQTDGEIADMGLLRYDSAMGWTPPEKDEKPVDEPPQADEKHGVLMGKAYYKYSLDDFSQEEIVFNGGGNPLFFAATEENYSFRFNLTPQNFEGELYILGYTTERKPMKGLGVCLTDKKIFFNGTSRAFTFVNGTTYEIELIFLRLSENTLYATIQINGDTVLWERIDAYGFSPNNVSVYSLFTSDSFTLS